MLLTCWIWVEKMKSCNQNFEASTVFLFLSKFWYNSNFSLSLPVFRSLEIKKAIHKAKGKTMPKIKKMNLKPIIGIFDAIPLSPLRTRTSYPLQHPGSPQESMLPIPQPFKLLGIETVVNILIYSPFSLYYL